jgi:hypothetical protein
LQAIKVRTYFGARHARWMEALSGAAKAPPVCPMAEG